MQTDTLVAVRKSPFCEHDLALARSIAPLRGKEEKAYMQTRLAEGIEYDAIFSPADARAALESHEEYVSGSRKRLGV